MALQYVEEAFGPHVAKMLALVVPQQVFMHSSG